MRARSRAARAGSYRKPVNPVSMTASKNLEGPEGADTAIVTKGVWLLSSDPRSIAMREATRPERRSFANAHQVIRAFSSLSHCLPIRGLGRVRYVHPLRSNVNQNILPGVVTLEFSAAPFVDPPADSGDLTGIELHAH